MTTVLKGVEGAMRGYRPQVDWGGGEGPATIKVGGHNVKVGTAGWRRRCLFTLLSALLLLSILNFILTVWLLRKIRFNAEGTGSMKIITGGVELDGILRLDRDLTVSKIVGRASEDLSISGYHNLSLSLINEEEDYESAVVLDPSGVSVATKEFLLKDSSGRSLFEARANDTSTGAKFFIVTGDEGALFYDSLQCPRIQGDDVHEFRIESKTRSVIGCAANLLRIEARDGDVTVTSQNDVSMTSSMGKFRFESPNVFFEDLVEAEIEDDEIPTTSPATETQIRPPKILDRSPSQNIKEKQQQEDISVYQVCVCPSGKLFLAATDSVCIPDDLTCL